MESRGAPSSWSPRGLRKLPEDMLQNYIQERRASEEENFLCEIEFELTFELEVKATANGLNRLSALFDVI